MRANVCNQAHLYRAQPGFQRREGRKKVSALQTVKHFPTRDQSYKIFYMSHTEGFDNKVSRKSVRIIPENSI
jgi:hypothetical protein